MPQLYREFLLQRHRRHARREARSRRVADGLKQDRYSFRSDLTEGLADAARTIAAESERDATKAAKGFYQTSIGYLARKQVEAFEQERDERIRLARQQIGKPRR